MAKHHLLHVIFISLVLIMATFSTATTIHRDKVEKRPPDFALRKTKGHFNNVERYLNTYEGHCGLFGKKTNKWDGEYCYANSEDECCEPNIVTIIVIPIVIIIIVLVSCACCECCPLYAKFHGERIATEPHETIDIPTPVSMKAHDKLHKKKETDPAGEQKSLEDGLESTA